MNPPPMTPQPTTPQPVAQQQTGNLAWTRLPSSALRLTGDDRLDFVQGQMTNDLRGASLPGMVPAAFLNPRGQLEAFARIYKRPTDIYLHLGEGEAAALAARFKKYIIFDQVTVEDLSDELATIHLWEPGELAGWNPGGPAAQQFELGGGLVLAGRVNRTGREGLDLHYLRKHEPSLLPLLGTEVSLGELDRARIAAGLPDPLRDGFAGSLPQEIGLDVGDALPAISYRKGCYVGQEIMARLEARGNARFHLVRLRGEALPSHAGITQNGKSVGQTGLSVGEAVLAKLRKEIASGETVEVAGQAATVEIPEHA